MFQPTDRLRKIYPVASATVEKARAHFRPIRRISAILFGSCGRYATRIVVLVLPWVKTPRLHSCNRYAVKAPMLYAAIFCINLKIFALSLSLNHRSTAASPNFIIEGRLYKSAISILFFLRNSVCNVLKNKIRSPV